MKRDCRSQGKVVRQLNVLHRAVPSTGNDEHWNVITRPKIRVQTDTDGIINGMEDVTLITEEESSMDEDLSELESDEDLEATEIDKTKFGKMAKFTESHRPSTPYAPEEQMKTLASQINQLLRYLNKPSIEYAYETPDIMAAMRQDFYQLSREVEQEKENLPPSIRKFLPTPDELDWINSAITLRDNEQFIQAPTNLEKDINVLLQQLGRPQQDFSNTKYHFHAEFSKYSQYLDLLKEFRDKGIDPEEILKWAKDAEASWEEPTRQLSDVEKQEIYEEIKQQSEPHWTQMTEENAFWKQESDQEDSPKNQRKRKANEISLETTTHYWMDWRNPEHVKLSWTACIHVTCATHYSDKAGTGYYPRKLKGFPNCKWNWFECSNDECPRHLWDKRTAIHFANHQDPQEIIQMQWVEHVAYDENSYAWECKQPSWHTCLNEACDAHAIVKDFHGYGKSFLDQRSKQKDLARRLTA
jgi:hypothetical protein